MDRNDYLPGEPILIGITVRNVGEEPFMDMAPLDPRSGHLSFEVSKDGAPVEWTAAQYTWLTAGDGLTLPQGEQFCDIFDLLTCFGSRKTVTTAGGSVRMRRVLEPGIYIARPIFRGRLSPNPTRSQIVVSGAELRFVVRDAASIPPAEARALNLIEDARAGVGRPPSISTWRGMDRDGLSSSRYFTVLAMAAWPTNDDSTLVEDVAEAQFRAGRGRMGAALLLKAKYQSFAEDLDSCEAWLHRAASRSSTFPCFLNTWDAYVTDRRKFARIDNSK